MRKMMLLGMGRSGTHAIIQWIANGMGGVVRQENNCFNGWKEKKLIYNSLKITGKGEAVGIIKSIDDFHLPLWDKLGMGGWEEFDHIITVVRSPKNWLASSIAAGGWADDYLDRAPEDEVELPVNRINAYMDYLEDYNVWHQDISSGYLFNPLHISINYDKWFNDNDYRRGIAGKFFKNPNVEKPKHCKFSSFKNNHDYTGDRSLLLNKIQKKRFDNLYKGMLQVYQERYFG